MKPFGRGIMRWPDFQSSRNWRIAMLPDENSIEFQMIYSSPLDCRGPMQLDDTLPENPTGEFLAKLAFEQSLTKGGFVDPVWSEEIGSPRVEMSPEFQKRSAARVARVSE